VNVSMMALMMVKSASVGSVDGEVIRIQGELVLDGWSSERSEQFTCIS
jgi:hypothetical protein